MKSTLSARSASILVLVVSLVFLSCKKNTEEAYIFSSPILNSPLEGDVFKENDTISISVDLIDVERINTVSFWINIGNSDSVLFTDTETPFEYAVKLPAGNHKLWVESIFNTGEKLGSKKVNISVEKVIKVSLVGITAPDNGGVFLESEEIQVSVDAKDSDGIEALSLWIDNTYHSADSTAPYTFSVNDLAVGSHIIKVSLQDSLGNNIDSEPINITIESLAVKYFTPIDKGIIVPERRSITLYIFKGGTSSTERDWNNPDNILWKLPLKNANGVAAGDMYTYNNLWQGGTSINDVKRVIHNGTIHLVVTGNGGDAVAMYEYATKKCIFWSGTTATGPHDADYAPVGNGYILVANPASSGAVLEVYDISSNNKGSAFSVAHKGVHSVHWDAMQKLIWAWGSGQSGLKSYKLVVQDGKPVLTDKIEYEVTVANYEVGMAHGGSPMLKDSRRYLILAGKDGLLRFDTESHGWSILRWAEKDKNGEATGVFRGSKGLSYSDITGEIIIGKSKDRIYSEDDNIGVRQLDNSEIYKARWWLHNSFSHEE